MCDCYTDCCKVCGDPIEMHLADFDTGQDEIEVYCGKHIPLNREDGLVWVYGDDKPYKRAFVRWLTDNAKANSDGNHPNYGNSDVENIPKGVLPVREEKEILDTSQKPMQGEAV